MINWNSEPYNDDFSEENKFLKVLFRPGKAVQTRELNQIQSILQNQISRQGDHLFKQGAMVVPGQISMDKTVSYVKVKDNNIQGTSVNSIIDRFKGTKVTGEVSGLIAEVIHVERRTPKEPATLFVRYLNSGSTQEKQFIKSEELTIINTEDSIGLDLSLLCVDTNDVAGMGSIASIERGVYYVNGYFVLVEPQTIVLERFSDKPSYRVGLNVVENIVKPENDSSLLDNSQNTPNYAAPGAHRYQMSLVLEKRAVDSVEDKNFIELLRVTSGVINKQVKTTEYAVLEKTLARRTFDESGNYTVKEFNIDVREDRNNNRGTWKASEPYLYGDVVSNVVSGKAISYVCVTKGGGISGSLAPTHLTGNSSDGTLTWKQSAAPYYNRGINLDGDESKLSVGIEPGKAYVQGYEIEKIAIEYLKLDKARKTSSVNAAIVPATVGNYCLVKEVKNAPDINEFGKYSLFNSSGVGVGSCRVRGLEYHDKINNISVFKLFIFDISLDFNKKLSDVKKVGGTNSSEFTCVPAESTINIYEPQNSSLVFTLPYSSIKHISEEDTYYSVTKAFTGSVVGGKATFTISSGRFASVSDSRNYVVFGTDGNVMTDSVDISLNSTGTTLTVGVGSVGGSITVLATIRKVRGYKTKQLSTYKKTITVKSEVEASTISLGKCDGYRLLSVKMASAGYPSNPSATNVYNVDITDRYTFDDGQTETHYSPAKISLKGSYAAPSGPIEIEFEFFNHIKGDGDYFTIESYVDVDYKEIPYFKNIPLRDAIDFRPRMDDDGSKFSEANSSLIPKRGIDVLMDFDFYLPRKSKVSLSETGNYFVTDGESSLAPGDAPSTPLSMVLYNLEVDPYTFGPEGVKIEKIDNKRYTMRDIGKLEKRIDNLEYYTTLSLLEQETNSMSVTDSDGNDRFKNGFIVDSFTGHGVGDSSNADYLCAVDMENGVLRPFFSMENVSLVENAISSSERDSKGYGVYGEVVMLPIQSHVKMIEQPYASRIENVNPFAVFTFIGTMRVNPSSDDWFETERKPDLIKNVEGNFNTIANTLESQGVMGTIWNSWQSGWAGDPGTYKSSMDQLKIGAGSFNQSIISRTQVGRVITETVANTASQARIGVKTSIVSKIDKEVVGDKTLSTSLIPYIRTRRLLVQAKGLKPYTKFYPFFDGINISEHCVPPINLKYTPIGGEFDVSTYAGLNAKEAARVAAGPVNSSLWNSGDVITCFGSDGSKYWTAVIMGKYSEKDLSGAESFYLQLRGFKSLTSTPFVGDTDIIATTNIAGRTIIGSISGATGTTVSSSVGDFTSNAKGELSFVYVIPNNDKMRFRTGTREIKLVDSENITEFTSTASSQYRAKGVLEVKQLNINAVRNAEVVREYVAENRVVDAGVSTRTWIDPLAQTFLVQNKGGAFLTKVDIFFASKDANLPVTLEIREVVNGYPGKYVLPFSRVTLNSSEVNISSSTINLNDENVGHYNTATTFSFNTPVYVNDNQEYCIVLLSDSNKYRVWISQIGETMPDSKRTISEQPYAGVLFKSQNGSTWTADQYQDLKFTLYKAKFDVSRSPSVEFVNDINPLRLLEVDPIEFKAGTNKVRVFQKDHGFRPGDKVTITGVVGSGTAVNGIPLTEINKEHIIPSFGELQLDSYVLELNSTATTSGYFGGEEVYATRHYVFSAVQPSIEILNFPDTAASYYLTATNYTTKTTDTVPVLANDTNTFLVNSKVINSSDVSNCKLSCVLSSSNDSLSPVIDLHRVSLIVINNKVNAPTEEGYVYPGFDAKPWKNGSSFLKDEFVYSGSDLFRVIATGGISTGSVAPTKENPGTGLAYIGEHKPFFVSDTKPSGSSTISNYITKRIKLVNPSTLIKVKFAANVPSQADIELYYRVSLGTGIGDFAEQTWVKATPEKVIGKVENGNTTFADVSYLVEANTFDSMQFKIAMKSTNTCAVPSVKDLRIIACA